MNADGSNRRELSTIDDRQAKPRGARRFAQSISPRRNAAMCGSIRQPLTGGKPDL